jgi:RecG-like helicase
MKSEFMSIYIFNNITLTKMGIVTSILAMSSDLYQVLTKARVAKLQSIGIDSIYSLLTLFPRKLQYMSPLEHTYYQRSEEKQYFFTGNLTTIEQRRGRRPFLVLTLSGKFNFTGYYFVTSRYIYQKLKTGQSYQVLVTQKNNLWTIINLTESKTDQNYDHFILGKAVDKDYLVPVYPKIKALNSAYFLAIHRQLPVSLYNINLSGLIPQNNIISQTINLFDIHHPISIESHNETRSQWLALQVFLKLSLIKYWNIDTKKTVTRAASLDNQFLNELIGSLPYELSPTQLTTTTDLIQDITIV